MPSVLSARREAARGCLDDAARERNLRSLRRLGPAGSEPVFDCQIDVRAKRILGTVPYSWSFALRSLPPGRSLRVPPALGELIATTNRHPDER